MIDLEDKVIKQFKNLLLNSEFPVSKIYLFGSRARKTNKQDSDYDFLVLLKDNFGKDELRVWKRKISYIIHKEIPSVSFDIVVKSESYFEENKNSINTLLNEINEEGILI